MASYLQDSALWRDLIPIPIFAAMVAYILVICSKESKEHQFRAFILLFSISLLGITTGQLTGQSREPAVDATVPAVLGFIGGIAIYLIAAKNIQQQLLVALAITAFSLNLLVGTFWGSRIRTDVEDYRNSEAYRLDQEIIEQNIRVQQLKHEAQLIEIRKLKGLPEKEPSN